MTLAASIKRLELHCVRERVAPYDRAISSSRDCAPLLTSLLGKYDHERMLVLLLDVKNRITGYTQAAQGGLIACAMTPLDVLRVAVVHGAPAIIVAHNHPSQDPAPSDADIAITHRIRDGATLLGIQLLDHLIVTSDPTRYVSLADRGLLSL